MKEDIYLRGLQVQPFPSFEEPLGFPSQSLSLAHWGGVACAWQELLFPDSRAGFVTLTHLPTPSQLRLSKSELGSGKKLGVFCLFQNIFLNVTE